MPWSKKFQTFVRTLTQKKEYPVADKVQVQVAGGRTESYDGVRTVGQLREKLNLESTYSATVKGEPADDDDRLEDYDFVAFGKKVKGGF